MTQYPENLMPWTAATRRKASVVLELHSAPQEVGCRRRQIDRLGSDGSQIVYSSRRGSRTIEHLGSAHDNGELEALKAAARQRLAAGRLSST